MKAKRKTPTGRAILIQSWIAPQISNAIDKIVEITGATRAGFVRAALVAAVKKFRTTD